ncbi:SGNH/GDSL hydrolase family protein [Xylanibacter muris]|uniref:SGNH/GDSL hydrolase family protein n=1 Tax=Xylanibacter muris TaxID=2736290 RepID=A0ABX2AL67_9BACT|nr:SGNH/GDSL hydrolase family protein [Xylanibacter muris]NPD91941.1 SGNH/GDSL hydrolase family protein [Xylanibacter muris]
MRNKVFAVFVRLLFSVFLPANVAGHPAADAHGSINVVLLGDSNTSIGGDSCNVATGWSKWFKERFAPASCISYARSGATWSNTSRTVYATAENISVLGDNNVIYNQINRLVEACRKGVQPVPQLIVISAGTNDAWFHGKRPGVFGKSVADVFAVSTGYITGRKVSSVLSLAESVRYGCELLIEAFPDAQIVMLTPIQSAKVPADMIRKAGDVIEECGRMMGINVIRQDYGGAVYGVRGTNVRRTTGDGVHTSEYGARRNGYYIANMIAPMLHF